MPIFVTVGKYQHFHPSKTQKLISGTRLGCEGEDIPPRSVQDRVGTLAEECCCIQPLMAEQNQAFLMEVFILYSVVWSIFVHLPVSSPELSPSANPRGRQTACVPLLLASLKT